MFLIQSQVWLLVFAFSDVLQAKFLLELGLRLLGTEND